MRSRNIKPGFFQNEDLVELVPETRLLFIGLWLMADRDGRLEDRPKKIKMQVFPADSWDVDSMLSDLTERGLIDRYVVDSKAYISIPAWDKHQNPHVKEKASTIPAPDKSGTSTVLTGLIPDSLIPDSLIPDSKPLAPSVPGEFASLKAKYPKRIGSQPWGKAEKAVNARLKDGATWQQLFDGLERYEKFCIATDKLRTPYVMQAATFFGPEKHYLEPWDIPATKSERIQDKNIAAAMDFLSNE